MEFPKYGSEFTLRGMKLKSGIPFYNKVAQQCKYMYPIDSQQVSRPSQEKSLNKADSGAAVIAPKF